MTKCRREPFAIGYVPREEGLVSSRDIPPGPIKAMAKSLEMLANGQGTLMISSLATYGSEPSIAPTILEFATGETANCAGGRNCARLYLALQGMVIPLRHTVTGMDQTSLEWWLRAMAEYATDRWKGSEQGVKAIAAAQPLIWQQTLAATLAWENVQRRSAFPN
ncbi:hypothetical protein [Mesorhizobium sp. ANAO-SY3R2]|uniref:hypothetical protein n=1 Tax=Mesorhizobium sp. ANAO-SY3R2 TaxID=3166644 RepID=UPI00367256A1